MSSCRSLCQGGRGFESRPAAVQVPRDVEKGSKEAVRWPGFPDPSWNARGRCDTPIDLRYPSLQILDSKCHLRLSHPTLAPARQMCCDVSWSVTLLPQNQFIVQQTSLVCVASRLWHNET